MMQSTLSSRRGWALGLVMGALGVLGGACGAAADKAALGQPCALATDCEDGDGTELRWCCQGGASQSSDHVCQDHSCY
jgi:hypothetical protein